MSVIHRLEPAGGTLAWTFGDRLRKVRRMNRLTQKALAQELGVTAHSVDAWESDRNLPRDLIGQATQIEDRFRLPRGWMLGYADGITLPHLDSNQEPTGGPGAIRLGGAPH